MIIAIDGPAASGKSTLARALAERLGLPFLDTGAMYRAVTWKVLANGIAPTHAAACARLAGELELAFDDAGHILVDGEPGEPAIRGGAVTEHVSTVSAHPGVRQALVPKQHAIAARRGAVAEGRDTTTVVFPNADHKFFLVATSAERAGRRARELGRAADVAAIQASIERRDELDATRADSPLREAADATRIETDGKSASAVLAEVLGHVQGEAAR